MLIRAHDQGFAHSDARDITPAHVYAARRALLRQLAGGLAGATLAAWAGREALAQVQRPGQRAALTGRPSSVPGATTLDKITDFKDASGYNNYYEFGTEKSDPARYAGALKTRPWALVVDGLIRKPVTLGFDELLALAPMEERIYRLRCVEGWSMVIPWIGYSLVELIRRVEPLGSAKYVQFITVADRGAMPGLGSRVLDWPYTEGLRLDEALHPLTLLAFGMYGELLPNQNGAPLRLVVPWKYGFKSAKSLVAIRFTEHEPATAWRKAAPREYGFYSNVNPDVDHPRWSQGTERRIGEGGLFAPRRKTLPFNGYAAQVGQLYSGMDLKKFF